MNPTETTPRKQQPKGRFQMKNILVVAVLLALVGFSGCGPKQMAVAPPCPFPPTLRPCIASSARVPAKIGKIHIP